MLVLGHRGASAAAPENTPAAFRLADRLGADGVELDVRHAPDGRLLVAHDPLPASVREIDALGLASFADVLDACGERMVVNVEIKDDRVEPHLDETMAMVEPIVAELRRRGRADRWLISSFSFDAIDSCRTLAPEIATAWLCHQVDDSVIERVATAGHAAVHPWEATVTTDVVRACHHAGISVNTWTCNDPDRLAELDAAGVDGVCTDVVDVALAALGRAGPAISPRWAARSR